MVEMELSEKPMTRDACRICLKHDRMVNLFVGKITDEKIPLNEAYMEVLNLPISICDGFPDGICFSCTSRVKEAYLLKRQAQRSIHSLMQMESVEKDNSVINERVGPFKIESKESVTECVGPFTIELKESDTSPVNDDIVKSEALDAVEFLLENKGLPNVKTMKSRPSTTSPERKHECQVCFKKFLRKSNLVDHLRLHANVKLFKCEYCSKAFVQSGNYKAHLRTHTNERPYVCQICTKSYNQSSALKIHIRGHTNERNYICDVCNKGFTNSSDLGKHKRVHDPSQKMKCAYCDKTFAQRANLRLHQTNYHQDQMDEIDNIFSSKLREN